MGAGIEVEITDVGVTGDVDRTLKKEAAFKVDLEDGDVEAPGSAGDGGVAVPLLTRKEKVKIIMFGLAWGLSFVYIYDWLALGLVMGPLLIMFIVNLVQIGNRFRSSALGEFIVVILLSIEQVWWITALGILSSRENEEAAPFAVFMFLSAVSWFFGIMLMVSCWQVYAERRRDAPEGAAS